LIDVQQVAICLIWCRVVRSHDVSAPPPIISPQKMRYQIILLVIVVNYTTLPLYSKY